jgi:acyl-CoA synthetase (AMP-forming)/AMP-acid ligase II
MEFLGELLAGNAEKFPNRTAAIHGDNTMTYRQLNYEADRLANSMRRIGLKKGDRAAMLMKSGIEWLLAFYACQKLGVGLALIHLRLLPEEMLRMVALTGADTLICSAEYLPQARYIAEHSGTNVRMIAQGEKENSPDGAYSFEELMRGKDCSDAQEDITGDDESIILFTSGTTSLAKGVVRTHRMMSSYASVLTAEESPGVDDIMLTPAPLYHATGICCVIKMLARAGTIILLDRFDCEEICLQVQKYHAAQIALVPPTSYRRLKASGFSEKYDFSSIKLAHVAAGKASQECFEDLFEMFPNAGVRLSWGSTEASNITSLILRREDIKNNRRLLASVGKVNPVSELRLVDDRGNVVEGAGKGEAFVRSPLLFSGYLNAPELTERSFSDGWFDMEDIMYRDEEGYYYLLDRKRDIIKTGGENVYAQEVEQDLLKNPAISECAVIGVPDKKYGEAIAAAIVLKDNCTLNGRDFIAFCRKVMPSFKKPKYWAFMTSLPKNDVGKVKKTLLRDQTDLFKPVE